MFVNGVKYEVREAVTSVEKMVEDSREILILYTCGWVSHLFEGSVDIGIYSEQSRKYVWYLPHGKALSTVFQDSFQVIKGRTSHGRWFYTSPIGLILVGKEEDEYIPRVQKGDWTLTEPNWLYQSLQKMQFLQTVPPETSRLEMVTDAYKLKQKKRVEELEEKQKKTLSEILALVDAPSNESNLALAGEVSGFDIYYDYSDDHRYCIRYRRYESELRDKLKEAGFPDMLDKWIAKVTGRKS